MSEFDQANEIFDSFSMLELKPVPFIESPTRTGRSLSYPRYDHVAVKKGRKCRSRSMKQKTSDIKPTSFYPPLERTVRSPPLSSLCEDDVEEPVTRHNPSFLIFHAKILCLGCLTHYLAFNASPAVMTLDRFKTDIRRRKLHQRIEKKTDGECTVHWNVDILPESRFVGETAEFSSCYFPTQQGRIHIKRVCEHCPLSTNIRIFPALDHNISCHCVSLK